MKTSLVTGSVSTRMTMVFLCLLLIFAGVVNADGTDNIYGRVEYTRDDQYVNAGFKHEGDLCVTEETDKYVPNSALTIAPDSYSYSVTGTGCGHYVYGVIDVDGVGGVSGFLYLENGKETTFYGEWVGDGVAEGVDNAGNLYTVKVDS